MSQLCPACSHPSPDGAKFCADCGTPFARTCPTCGHPDAGTRFCPECGTPLAPAARAASGAASVASSGAVTAAAPVSERRTTTVLFGDLVAFTTLSETRDPEEVRELLSTYFTVARTVVGRYGGTIEKFIGDAVMAVWGVPVGHEDDAERAVRAGLDLVAEVAALGASVGAPELSMRVGVVTGSVAVTLGAVGEGMVAGDAVNTAARVQTAAAPGTVWVDATTRGLTAAAVAFSDMGEHVLKGKAEPARLHRADTVVAAVGGAQRVDGLEAPMVGRDAELRRVKELFHATEADGRPRLAVVTGVAGVGKSRLGWEYEKYTDGLSDGVRWHRGRCRSYGDGVAFWAFAEMVRSRLGVGEELPRDQLEERVRRRVGELAQDADEAAWLAPRVLALLGGGERTFERVDLFVAWTMLLDRVGGEQPVVLLLEDAHHAEPALLDLVEHLLASSRARLFVLLFGRPELLEKRPGLATHRAATRVDLPPLPDAAMATLVDGLVDDLPPAARGAVVARAEGIPLYAVETVRSLVDRDVVVPREGRYVLDPAAAVDLDQLAAPTSLQTLISARLDALTPAERRTAQDAAVLGLAFTVDGLRALSELDGPDLEAALAGLVRKGVVEAEVDALTGEAGGHRFTQALVREVAYGTLSRRDRRARHLAVADHLEHEELADALAGITAQHLLDALDAGGERDPDRSTLQDRARALLATAAARAEALGSPGEALRAAVTSLELDPGPLETAELLERAGRAARDSGDLSRAADLAGRAVARWRALDRPVDAARAVSVQQVSLQYLGRGQESADLAREGLRLLDAADGDDPRTRLELIGALNYEARSRGDTAAELDGALAQARIAETHAEPDLLVRALTALAIALIDTTPTAYRAVLAEAVSLAREHRILDFLALTLSNLCAEMYGVDLARATDYGREAVDTARRTGDALRTEVALINHGFTCWLAGRWDEILDELATWLPERGPTAAEAALRLVQVQVALARDEPLPPLTGLLDSDDPWEQQGKDLVTAIARSRSGDLAGGARAAHQAVRRAFDAGIREDLEVHGAPAVELALQAGHLDDAADLLGLLAQLLPRPLVVAETARLRGMLAAARGEEAEADLRAAEAAHAAYGAPYLLARTRHELARWLVDRGRVDEARPLVTQAREAYAALGAAAPMTELAGVLTRPVTA